MVSNALHIASGILEAGLSTHSYISVCLAVYRKPFRAVNVRGSFLMTKYSLIEMNKRNYGRILLVASIAGKEVTT